MTLQDLFAVIRKRRWFIIVPTLVLTAAVAAYSYGRMPNRYTARTTLYVLVSEGPSDNSNRQNLSTAVGVSDRIVEDVARLVKSDRVRDRAAEALGISSLGDNDISVVSDTKSLVVQVVVTGLDAQGAADVANAVAAAVTDVSHDLTGVSSFKVVDKAATPSQPSGPNRLKYVLEAFGGSLLASITLALLPSMFDDRIRNTDAAEQLSGMPVLGCLSGCQDVIESKASILSPSIWPDEIEACEALEASQTILTNLSFLLPGESVRSIAVTSLAGLEGGPTVANLVARAAASSGRPVLLMECDFRHRSLADLIGVYPTHGLFSVLTQGCALGQAVCEGGHQNVFFLDAEQDAPNPTELLSSARFKQLLAILKEHFSHVVLSAPPLESHTDSPILSSLSDATLLVVRNGITRAERLEKGAEQLRKAGATVAGIAFNQDKPSPEERRRARGTRESRRASARLEKGRRERKGAEKRRLENQSA